jgi:hypothetical protein
MSSWIKKSPGMRLKISIESKFLGASPSDPELLAGIQRSLWCFQSEDCTRPELSQTSVGKRNHPFLGLLELSLLTPEFPIQ